MKVEGEEVDQIIRVGKFFTKLIYQDYYLC